MFKYLQTPVFTDKSIARGFAKTILDEVSRIKAKRVVIDPINVIGNILTSQEYRSFLYNLIVMGFKSLGVTSVLIAELPIGGEVIGHGFEEFIADIVFILKMVKYKGLVKRVIEVRKIRENPIVSMEAEYIIDTGGIKLFSPYFLELKGGYGLERVTTGLSGLDRMLNGGLLKGSATMIVGPSGSGKTLIALNIAIANALRGKKVIYTSYEESREQLINTIRSMGYDYDAIKDKLIVTGINPAGHTPASLYHYIVNLLDKEKADIRIADGITALEKHFGTEAYINLTRALLTKAKSLGITYILTKAENVEDLKHHEISTLVDIIIALYLQRVNNSIERKIAILKFRGSPHDNRVRTLKLEGGKVTII